MKLAIMQPYLFPYLGYFQLIHAVDEFVVYDDVNYKKGGWINRNKILNQGEARYLTLQVNGASPNVPINQVKVGGNRKNILKTVSHAYARAPLYHKVYPLLERVILDPEPNLALYIASSLKQISEYLGITTRFRLSSGIEKNNDLRGLDKVFAICEKLGATRYINSPGGRELYSGEDFRGRGIELLFVNSNAIEYRQFDGNFLPGLSIIDVIMFNSQQQCAALLSGYSLEP